MRYLVDSDWVADFLAGRSAAISLIRDLLPDGLGLSIVSYVEVMEGVRGSRYRSIMEEGFDRLLVGVQGLDLTVPVANRAADIRLQLLSLKRQVNHRAMDLLIAATAIEHDLTLVTRNIKHVVDVPELGLYPLL